MEDIDIVKAIDTFCIIVLGKKGLISLRVLVVEDARDMNRLIVKMLKKKGYSVDGCFDGQEALEYLLGADYDAILLDVMLPKLGGYQLLQQLRSKGGYPGVISQPGTLLQTA